MELKSKQKELQDNNSASEGIRVQILAAFANAFDTELFQRMDVEAKWSLFSP